MANAWSTPHYVPSTANGPIPPDQRENSTQPDTNAVIQNCPCPICSRTTRNLDYQTTTGRTENLRPVVCTESVTPYANQNVGNAYQTGITTTEDFPTRAWSVTQQTPYQENAGYAPLYEAAGPPQIQIETAPNEGAQGLSVLEAVGPVLRQNGAAPNEAQAIDTSVPERLRRLARRFVDNPESLVNGVHLDPDPFGRFQVVITIDITNILGIN